MTGQTGFPSIDKPWLKYYKAIVKEDELPEMTMYDYAWENNRENLDTVALRYFDNKISYRALFNEIEKAACAFWNAGVRKGDIVTIMSIHTPETAIALYALNYIGAVSNFIYPTMTEKEVREVLKNTGSKLLLVLEPIMNKVFQSAEGIEIPVILLSISDSMPLIMKTIYKIKTKEEKIQKNTVKWKEFISENQKARQNKDEVTKASDHNAVAVMVSTSGTTGEPKAVCLSNDSLNKLVAQDRKGLVEFKRGKDCLLILPPFIGFGIAHIHILICTGVECILQIKLDQDSIVKSFFRYKPYCFLTGPVNADRIIKHKATDISSLRYFIGGGGEISEKQEKTINSFLKECNTEAIYSNGYGMTEAASILTVNINEVSKPRSIGIPLMNTVVKVVDIDTGKELMYGEEGELWFNSPCIMTGYYKNQDATDNVIVTDHEGKRWLRTGDIGTVDTDGFVFFKGRLKRIYVTRGLDGMPYKIFPQRIEELFIKQNGIHICGVIVREDEKRKNVPVAFVSLDDGSKDKKQQIIDKLKNIAAEELPAHMRPDEIIILDEIPTTSSGKIDYCRLEKMA